MRKIWEDYRWILATAVGSTIFALGFSLFLQPNEISPGGISGLALVAVELLGYGSVGVLTILINLPLFILGGVKIGRRFFCGRLLGMILSSILIDAFAKVAMPPMDSLLCALYGGMICGLGLGMVFICGTSTGGSAIVAADEMEVSGAGTVITAETDSTDEDDYALELEYLTRYDGLVLVEGEMNKSKKARIARPEQAPTYFKVYWVVHPGDEPVNGGMQIPGAIFGSEEEERLFEGWFLEDGTRLEDSPYYMGPGVDHVGNLDRDVTFYGHWRTAESGEGSPDGGDGFGTLLAVGAVVGVAGVVAYQVGTELILDQLLPAGVAVPHTRAELAMLLWNTAGRPAPAALPAFADVADPEMAQAAQWAIEQGYLKARADGSFKPDKGVAKWRVIRGYRAVTEP